MKIVFKVFSLCLLGLLIFSNPAMAQDPNPVKTEAEVTNDDLPLDDIVEKRLVDDRMVLPYAPIREADVFWENMKFHRIPTHLSLTRIARCLTAPERLH